MLLFTLVTTAGHLRHLTGLGGLGSIPGLVPGLVPGVVAQIPNPAPTPPPGTAAAAITQVVGIVKWVAGISLVVGFFGGVAVFAGGRLVDHHRIGRVGTMMMMASIAGAVLYAAGYTLITGFAGNG